MYIFFVKGRCKWFNPVQKAEDEFEDEEDEGEEKEQIDEPEPEQGPALLTSIDQDARKPLFIHHNVCTYIHKNVVSIDVRTYAYMGLARIYFNRGI